MEVEICNRPESLIAPDRELELDKSNDQALNSSINFGLSSYYTRLIFELQLYMTSVHDFFYLDSYLRDNYLPS